MREAQRELLLKVIADNQPVSESAIADHLGNAAPHQVVLGHLLMQLEVAGEIRRDNNRRFHIGTPVIVKQEEEEVAPKEETKHCPKCDRDVPADQMQQNGQCKKCGKEYREARKARLATGEATAPKPKGKRRTHKAKQSPRLAEAATRKPASKTAVSITSVFRLEITDSAGQPHDIELTRTGAHELSEQLAAALE